MARAFRRWDDYFIPGTQVLRNLHRPELREQKQLDVFENRRAELRLVELTAKPVQGAFDAAHHREIHRRIFQDVYEWAGQVRQMSGPMTKNGPDVLHDYPPGAIRPFVGYQYCPGEFLAGEADRAYGMIKGGEALKGLDIDSFADRLGEVWGEVNTVHLFREGNTRSQCMFFQQLAEASGYTFDPRDLNRSDVHSLFLEARFHNQATARHDRLTAIPFS